MILLKNGFVYDGGSLKKLDVLISNKTIKQIGADIKINNAEVFDVKGCWIIPGAIDVHTHLREPGYERKETILTGTGAAARGGVTTAMAMANLDPVPDSLKNLKIEQDLIKKDALVKVFPYAAVTVGRHGKELVDFSKLKDKVKAFSDDGGGFNDMNLLEKAAVLLKDSGAIICSHAEADGYDAEQSEIAAVERELEVVHLTGVKYHFCHLSQKESLEKVKEAKANGLDVSCEVTPHHLVLNSSYVKDTNFKMNPPLRCEEDRQAVENALMDGTADMIATDHAPHTEEEKALPFEEAPNGIIGLETFLPVVYTHFVKSGKASHGDFLNWCVINPAKRFNLLHGEIKVGGIADIAVLDIENEWTVKDFVSKGKNSPFKGQKLFGNNILTLVDGKAVYKDKRF